MTQAEFTELISRYNMRKEQNWKRLEAYARGLVPTLRDAQRPSAADELARLIFAIDAEEQQMETTVKEIPPGEFALLLARMMRGGGGTSKCWPVISADHSVRASGPFQTLSTRFANSESKRAT